MTDSDFVAGLDLGSTKICCVVAKLQDSDPPEIVGVGVSHSPGVSRGVVTDIDGTAEAIREAVRRASSQAGADITAVFVGVSGQHIQSLTSHGVAAITHPTHEITEADRIRAVEQSQVIVIPTDRVILHAIPRMYTIDGQDGIRKPVGMCGGRLEVETHIVTASRNPLINMQKCLERAELDIEEQVLASLASGAAVLSPSERDDGICLLDIGGGTTDVAVFADGEVLYTAVLPVGGNHVTNDIAQVLKVSAMHAEQLKIEHGRGLATGIGEHEAVQVLQIGKAAARPLRRRALCEIIEARMKELFELAKKNLDQVGALSRCKTGVVLTGGGALLEAADECARAVLRMPVRIGRPTGIGRLAASSISGAAGIGQPHDDDGDSPVFATAVGLVQWAAALAAKEEAEPPGFWASVREWFQSLRRGRSAGRYPHKQ